MGGAGDGKHKKKNGHPNIKNKFYLTSSDPKMGLDNSDRYFDQEQFETNQKSL